MTIKSCVKIFGAFGLAGIMASCSNDLEIEPNGPNVGPGGEHSAFMTVRLHDVNSGTRAEGDEEGTENPDAPQFPESDPNYSHGDKAEYTISSARFFFFDADGTFVSEANAWNGVDEGSDQNANVSLEGNTIVVLKNLTSGANPRYMLTAINADGFRPSSTLEQTARSLVNWHVANSTSFMMSGSSYLTPEGSAPNHEDFSNGQARYYATVLDDHNFTDGHPEFGAIGDNTVVTNAPTPVDVYVERLAAKVEVDYSKLTNEKITVNGKTLYKLGATVGGTLNNEGIGDPEGVTDLYLYINDWDLNGTQDNSYFAKQFDPSFSIASGAQTPWQGWNHADWFRSYWAAGVGYGKEVDANPLHYVKFNQGKTGDHHMLKDVTALNSFRYCNEFTNIPANYKTAGLVDASKLTHVALKATICDKNGNAIPMVRATNGVLFMQTESNPAYLNYVLNSANVTNGLNVWYVLAETGETWEDKDGVIHEATETEYRQVDATMVKYELSGEGTGLIIVKANLPEDKTWATYNAATNTYTKLTDIEGGKTAREQATELLTTALTITENDGNAMAYTGGSSWYYIPIEHQTSVNTDKEVELGAYKEGYYGVVRNHWYKVNINSILKVGYGVFNPGSANDEGETLIPPRPEDPAKFVAANLKVLSWKLVNQNVDIK